MKEVHGRSAVTYPQLTDRSLEKKEHSILTWPLFFLVFFFFQA